MNPIWVPNTRQRLLWSDLWYAGKSGNFRLLSGGAATLTTIRRAGTFRAQPAQKVSGSLSSERNASVYSIVPGAGMRLDARRGADDDARETELRAELETISSDAAWIDEMVAAMPRD